MVGAEEEGRVGRLCWKEGLGAAVLRGFFRGRGFNLGLDGEHGHLQFWRGVLVVHCV